MLIRYSRFKSSFIFNTSPLVHIQVPFKFQLLHSHHFQVIHSWVITKSRNKSQILIQVCKAYSFQVSKIQSVKYHHSWFYASVQIRRPLIQGPLLLLSKVHSKNGHPNIMFITSSNQDHKTITSTPSQDYIQISFIIQNQISYAMFKHISIQTSFIHSNKDHYKKYMISLSQKS